MNVFLYGRPFRICFRMVCVYLQVFLCCLQPYLTRADCHVVISSQYSDFCFNFILEFAVNEENVTSKAQHLEEMLTMLYSMQSIKGVVFWGFWDGQIWEPKGALYNGESCTVSCL